MSDDTKRRGLTPEQWSEARKAYEAGEAVLSIAKRLGARRQTIMDRAKREIWTAQPTVHVSGPEVQRTAQRKVIDIATKRAVDGLVQDGTIDRLAGTMKSSLERMSAIETGLLEVAEKTVQRLRGDEGTTPLRESAMASEAADIKAAIEAVGKTIDLYGKLRGLGVGDAILGAEDDSDTSWQVEHVVVGPAESAAS